MEHFESVYHFDLDLNQDSCFGVIPNLVLDVMNERLGAPISSEEIKVVAVSTGALKAHGPDGLSALFYQKNQ